MTWGAEGRRLTQAERPSICEGLRDWAPPGTQCPVEALLLGHGGTTRARTRENESREAVRRQSADKCGLLK